MSVVCPQFNYLQYLNRAENENGILEFDCDSIDSIVDADIEKKWVMFGNILLTIRHSHFT